jgi:transposase InsO family protein
MQLHANAKTTPKMRDVIVRRVVHQDWTYRDAAAGAGVSVRTVAKWVARFRRQGTPGFADRSSRPRRQPTATPVRTISAIIRLRQVGLPAWQIARRVGRPRSTVSVILRRVGLGRLTAPTPPPQRYEWPNAGDLLHLDIKPLGRFGAIGHRIHGNRRVRSRGVGWEYVHVAIDDATRVAFVEVLPKQNGDATADFLARAIAWFARQGIQIRRVMSDNGSGYVSRAFRRACQLFAVRHVRTRPYTPRTNGKAERFIQTLLREWAYARAYRTSIRRTDALAGWLTYYNRQRPHASLDYRAPWSRLRAA